MALNNLHMLSKTDRCLVLWCCLLACILWMIMYAVNAPPATGWEARTGMPLSVWAAGLPNNYEQLILQPSWLEAIFSMTLFMLVFLLMDSRWIQVSLPSSQATWHDFVRRRTDEKSLGCFLGVQDHRERKHAQNDPELLQLSDLVSLPIPFLYFILYYLHIDL